MDDGEAVTTGCRSQEGATPVRQEQLDPPREKASGAYDGTKRPRKER
jgi:hypothetical protein